MVYLNMNVSMWTADLKTFVMDLIPKAFPPDFPFPPSITNGNIKHQSSTNYCDIVFQSKDQASHFISWVSANSIQQDSHDNTIKLFAKFSASPKEQAMGRLLTASYKFILENPVYDAAAMKLQTNRSIGTLSVRYKGLAHVILQVVFPRVAGAPPFAKRGKIVSDAVPGFNDELITQCIELANSSITAQIAG